MRTLLLGCVSVNFSSRGLSVFAMLTLAVVIGTARSLYVGYCDANVAGQPNQVTRVQSEHANQLSWFDLQRCHLCGLWLKHKHRGTSAKIHESLFVRVILYPCLFVVWLTLRALRAPALHRYITLANQFMLGREREAPDGSRQRLQRGWRGFNRVFKLTGCFTADLMYWCWAHSPCSRSSRFHIISSKTWRLHCVLWCFFKGLVVSQVCCNTQVFVLSLPACEPVGWVLCGLV